MEYWQRPRVLEGYVLLEPLTTFDQVYILSLSTLGPLFATETERRTWPHSTRDANNGSHWIQGTA